MAGISGQAWFVGTACHKAKVTAALGMPAPSGRSSFVACARRRLKPDRKEIHMFVTPSGHRFVLANHSLGEWAATRMSDLLRLGCSDATAGAVYLDYVNAKRPGEEEA